jgi:hypothetical protein
MPEPDDGADLAAAADALGHHLTELRPVRLVLLAGGDDDGVGVGWALQRRLSLPSGSSSWVRINDLDSLFLWQHFIRLFLIMSSIFKSYNLIYELIY